MTYLDEYYLVQGQGRSKGGVSDHISVFSSLLVNYQSELYERISL